jgi:hypothetical protein
MALKVKAKERLQKRNFLNLIGKTYKYKSAEIELRSLDLKSSPERPTASPEANVTVWKSASLLAARMLVLTVPATMASSLGEKSPSPTSKTTFGSFFLGVGLTLDETIPVDRLYLSQNRY